VSFGGWVRDEDSLEDLEVVVEGDGAGGDGEDD